MFPLAGAGLKLSHPTFTKPNMYSALLLTTGTLQTNLHASEATHIKILVWEWRTQCCEKLSENEKTLAPDMTTPDYVQENL